MAEDYLTIPLSGRTANGATALVSPEDHQRLSSYKWYCTPLGYAFRQERSGPSVKWALMHREVTNAPRGMHVHHINGDKLDNRRGNLAVLTPAEHRLLHGSAISYTGIVGVRRVSKTHGFAYRAGLCRNGRRHELGTFASLEDAVAVVRAFRRSRGESPG